MYNLSTPGELDFFDEVATSKLYYWIGRISGIFVIVTEHVYLTLCKTVTKCSTPNCVIYGELWRCPLYIDVKQRWCHSGPICYEKTIRMFICYVYTYGSCTSINLVFSIFGIQKPKLCMADIYTGLVYATNFSGLFKTHQVRKFESFIFSYFKDLFFAF
jgi:hypothetical protein